MKRGFALTIICVVLLCCSLVGCQFRSLPSVTYTQQCFQENKEDVLVVVNYLVNSKYADVFIRDSYVNNAQCEMLADLEIVCISDPKVCMALKSLLERDFYKTISKSGNTINFLQWSNSFGVSCGVAYSINGKDLPDIQFGTEVIALSDKAWYYYIDDYNMWRSLKE